MKVEEGLSKEAGYNVCDKLHLLILCIYFCSPASLIWPLSFMPFKKLFDYLCLFLSRGTSVKFMEKKLI